MILILITLVILGQLAYIYIATKQQTDPERIWKKSGNKWNYKKRETPRLHLLCCGAPPNHKGPCINKPRQII